MKKSDVYIRYLDSIYTAQINICGWDYINQNLNNS